jgi:hypothetical protein
MSLTLHLRSPASPVRAYLEEAFPMLEQSKRGSPLAKELSSFLGFSKLPSCRLPTFAPKSNQSTIGTAVDYRFRYHFCSYDAHETVAALGVRMLGGKAGKVGRRFLDHHNEFVGRLAPVGRQLGTEDEAALNTNCVTLAWFEQVFRINAVFPEFDSLLKRGKVEDLVAGVQPEMINDISQLSTAFASDAKALFKANAILNPTFLGSRDIAGDADIIVDNTIIDFKCTAKTDASKLRDAAYQLLGYVLLDYDNEYAISDLMVYLPRQRDSWRVPLWHFVLAPADVSLLLTRKDAANVDALVTERLRERRKEFRKIVRSL